MPRIEPTDLVRVAGRHTEMVFAHEHGAFPWLLVRVGAEDDELSAALRAADAKAPAPSPGAIAFKTEAVSVAQFRSTRHGAPGAEPDVSGLMNDLGDGRYHAVAVRKRTEVDAAFGGHVSVGRAPNKDIVLRHPSVSKFHAYFRAVPGWQLVDAGSKNGIVVNGARVKPRESVEVGSGDQVTFGSVATVLLDATTLWRVLRAR